MARPRKDNRPITVRLASDIYDRLDDFSQRTGMMKTAIVEKALVAFMDEAEREQELLEELKRNKPG